jgi:thiamine pyrophosphate-dependent acetolactate synthase large subunit-like protein
VHRDPGAEAAQLARRDVPVPSTPITGQAWGSDAIAELLRALAIRYVVVNPGASFRGLHDSIVNHLGNQAPQMLLVLHEEHAVAIAHGYAKVTGQPLAAILHSNVGLMHGSMAIFNAWADRVPVLVLGATGPLDAAKRRPWIDWLHTATDQAALVRPFVKWDAQPTSVAAAQEALLRAHQIAMTAPQGPVYVCFDAELQESRLPALPPLPEVHRFAPARPVAPAGADLQQVADWLAAARHPVLLAGRVSRSPLDWLDRVALAERWGARVITDLKTGAAFPTRHPLHAGPAGIFLSPESAAVLRQADLVLSLDWVDLAGTLKQAWGEQPVGSRVVHASMDHHLHNGWGGEHQGLPPADLFLPCGPEALVTALMQAGGSAAPGGRGHYELAPVAAAPAAAPAAKKLGVPDVARALRAATAGHEVCLIRLPLSWSGDLWDFDHPLDFLGYDGGAGIGSGPGMAVGAALALKGSARLPLAVLGDGDYLMAATALWTATQARIPLLLVVVNNRSFFNDELHQERVARQRGRPVENRWIGQRIADPAPDLAQLARAQGATGFGPVGGAGELQAVLAQAVAAVRAGETVVVDVLVQPGYARAMEQALTRAQAGDGDDGVH